MILPLIFNFFVKIIKKNISTQNYCVIIPLLCIIKMKKRWNLTEII